MAEQRIDGAGCLGRVLTLLGIIWLGVVVFAGLFGLRDDAGGLATLIGSTLPALVLLGAGRTLSRRAAERRDAPSLPQPEAPTTPSSTSQTQKPPAPPAPAPSQPSEVFPKPTRSDPAPQPEPPVELPPPPTPSPPKTSQEMIEEARKRWGTGPRPGKEGSDGGF
jgi:outer membrane biosynthesis protein TonB